MKKLFFLSFSLLSVLGFSQKTIATISVEKESVSINEPIVITLTINARATDVKSPELNSFTVLSTPGNKKTYSEMVGMDADAVEMVRETYTACIVPKMAGKFTIKPFIFKVGDKEVQSNELKIKVDESRISFEDSAAVAKEYTGFSIGYEGSKVETKTAIDYNKEDKTLVPKEKQIGKGQTIFEVKAQKTTLKVKAGAEFTVTYDLYKEAPKSEFSGNIELVPFDDIKGLTIIDGPARHLKVETNSTTKVQSGTADILVEAMQKGTYHIPSLKAKYGDVIVLSEVIEVIVE